MFFFYVIELTICNVQNNNVYNVKKFTRSSLKCILIGEDPKLICREMPESRQIVAGLMTGDRPGPRSVRSIRYDDSDSVNIFVAIFGMFIVLLILGKLILTSSS